MATDLEYALMAGDAYVSSRPNFINQLPVPDGWVSFNHRADSTTGFEAVSFTNGSEIVISYAGTNPDDVWNDIVKADFAAGLGVATQQLYQAAEYYMQVKAANPQAQITFTGHSLGGGLASLMAVFFNEAAVTFDQAPFRNSASLLVASVLKDALMLKFPSATYPQASQWLDPLDKFILSFDPFGLGWSQDGLAAREAKVTGYNTQGEFLSIPYPIPVFRIGTSTPLSHGTSDFSLQVALHSQSLLTAFLKNKSFEDVTFKLPDLLRLVFDSKMYNWDTKLSNENFIERLVRHEFGNTPDGVQADAMLTRFTSDLWKLAQDGGLTMKDGDTTYLSAMNDVSKALIAFAMQMYYEDTANATNSNKQLFTDLSTAGEGSNGIRFDIADVSKDLAAKIPSGSVKLEDLQNDIKGFKQYFSDYLTNGLVFTAQERQFIQSIIPTLRDWYVQAGTSGMDATDSQNRGAFMLGGSSNDELTGGTGNDLLVGNAGIDVLTGGAGSDTLLGGAGDDTYVYATGDGLDTILDSDGQGSITDDGLTLTGGSQYGDNRVHQDAQGHLYVQADANTLLIDGNLIVEGYSTQADGVTGALGLTMRGPDAEVDIVAFTGDDSDNFISGDVYTRNASSSSAYQSVLPDGTTKPVNLDGSVSDNILEGGLGSDILSGGAGNDRLYADTQIDVAIAIADGNTQTGTGLKGDWLAGGSGDDTVVGSANNDVLTGGGGNDLIIGGAGDDDILGDSNWVASTFDWSVTDTDAGRMFAGASGNPLPADAGADVIYAGSGNDHVWSGQGNDVIFGEDGNDQLSGNGGNDVIFGGEGSDILDGDGIELAGITETNPGNDYLDGGAGDDYLYGKTGDDVLIGGTDNDTLYGGDGQDTYIFNKGDGIDTVYDTKADNNIFKFGAGFDSNTIKLHLGSLLLDMGDGDQVHIGNFDQNDVFNSSSIGSFEFADGTTLTTTQLLARGFDLDGTAGDDTIIGTNTTDRINGYAGNDTLVGGLGTDTINGGDDNDILAGDQGSSNPDGGDADALDGGAGNDTLFGQGGDDTLTGGTGTDQLQGGAGNDTYIFNLGDGQDTLIDDSGYNTIQFGAGITAESIRATYDAMSGNLILDYGTGTDAITIAQGFSGNTVQTYRFADNSQLTHAQLMATALQSLDYGGTTGNDTITGSRYRDILLGNDGDDTLAGQDGNDQLTGNSGNDTLDGGTGDDTLDGGTGSDTYRYRLGDGRDTLTELPTDSGTDTLVFGPGITASDLRHIRQDNGNLIIEIANPDPSQPAADSLTIAHWFNTSSGQPHPTRPIERIVFADGTELTAADLANLPIAAIEGTAGDDTLTGTRYDDTLAGHDGHDTYQLGLGQGADTLIEAAGQTSTLRLDPGITLANANAWQRGNDLAIVLDNGSDSLTIKDYYSSHPQSIGIEDANGNRIDADNLVAQTAAQSTDNTAVIGKLISGWLLDTRQGIAQNYLNQGYRYTSPGILSITDRSVSASYAKTDETVVTEYLRPDGTHATLPAQDYEYFNAVLTDNSLFDGQVNIATPTLVTDAASINISDGYTYSASTSIVLTTDIDWEPLHRTHSYHYSYSNATSGGYLYHYDITETHGTVSGEVAGFTISGGNPSSGNLFGLPDNVRLRYGTRQDDYTITQVVAGSGNNNISGATVADGGAGDDVLTGSALLYGNQGNDTLYGGDGNDLLVDGEGSYKLADGTANDSDWRLAA